jgi:hypothetical protein
MRKLFCVSLLFTSALVPSGARAHIRLTSPTARYVQDNNGLKTGPCGSGTRTGSVTELVPGQTVTVTWKESVSHAGHYRIALASSESTFVEPTSLSIPSPLPSWDLADGIQDKTGTQTYSQSVQIPQKECPACVLQLIQVMSAGTDGTNTGTFSGVYHACADVSISGGMSDGGNAPEVGTDDANQSTSSGDASSTADGLLHDAAAGSGGAEGRGGSGAGGEGSAQGGSPGHGGEAGSAGAGGGGAGAGASGGNSGNGGSAGGADHQSGGQASEGVGAAGKAGGATGAGGSANATPAGRGGSTGSADGAAPGCSCALGSRVNGSTGFAWALAMLADLLRRQRRRIR